MILNFFFFFFILQIILKFHIYLHFRNFGKIKQKLKNFNISLIKL